jgi:hypothetical protein
MSTKRTILTWGLISGAVSGGMMMVTVPFVDKLGFERAEIFGYTTLVLSALMIFFGIRSYREHVAGGSLTYGKGFLVGLGIAAVASICYVVVWLVIFYSFFPDFYATYAAHMVDKATAAGASADQVAKITAQATQIRQVADNPLLVIAMTFAESFPIGLVAAAISAGILRRRSRSVQPGRTVQTA